MKKAFYSGLDTWSEALKDLQYPRNLDDIVAVVNNHNMQLEDFKDISEAFYATYLEILGYLPGHGLSTKLTRMFNNVAKILLLIGDFSPETVTQNEKKVFIDYLQEDDENVEESGPFVEVELPQESLTAIQAILEKSGVKYSSNINIYLNEHTGIIRSF